MEQWVELQIKKNPFLFKEIAKRFTYYENVQFIWIGDGELKDYLTSENITITGCLNKEEALNKLADIDIYLSTSLWEGLPFNTNICFTSNGFKKTFGSK